MTRRRHGRAGEQSRGERNLRRRVTRLPEKPRILIVCEGRETEPNYFRGLRDEQAVRYKFRVEVRKGKGGSSLDVVQTAVAEQQKAVARQEDFDEVWCVLDVEQASQREQVSKARTLADQHGIQLALSNPVFEVWLLAHFVRTRRSFAAGAPVIVELNKHLQRAFTRDYEKNDEKVYDRLRDLTRTGISNSRTVRTHDWDWV